MIYHASYIWPLKIDYEHMKKNIFFSLLIGCILLFPQHTFAQSGLKSGSLQIVISNTIPSLTEITGPMSFREAISETLILSNLIPGEYMVKIYSSPYGNIDRRGGYNTNPTTFVNQIFRVSPERRTVISVSRNGFSTTSVYDENSYNIIANINPDVRPDYPVHLYRGQPMNDREFGQFYEAVKNASFDIDKMKLISAVAPGAIFTTEQIRLTMNIFSFDDRKFECAKIMGEKVYDGQNLYLLVDEFSFSTTKDKFYDFIRSIPPPTPYNR